MKITVRISIFILILLTGLAAVAIYWTFYRPLPNYSATHELPGLHQPVDIHWDSFGVPHIYGSSPEDLYYAVGYVHAQDRLWQMTLNQLLAEGRFAEYLGEEFVEFDIHQRTLGFWETARRIEESAPRDLIELLEAYARGVNDYVEQNRRNLPIEFTLLDVDPPEWSPAHSFAMSRLMSWEMNVSWWSKPIFAWFGDRYSDIQLREITPTYEDHFPVMMNEALSRQAAGSLFETMMTDEAVRSLAGRAGVRVGSNAWAVSGDRTDTGDPILAGDPHLALSIPGHWYELHLSLDGENLAGATIPGAPIIVLGQNNHYAWSMTNMMIDDTDFFIEKPHPDDPNLYVADSLDGEPIYESYQWRDELIRINGSDDRIVQIKETRNGPVISSIHPDSSFFGDYEVSMRWTGHDASQELWALYQINWGQDMEQFTSALESFRSPGQNFIYADRDGNIAIFSAGAVPIRQGNPLQFRPGWDPDAGWQGTIPFRQLPRVVNPESGYVANANNKLATDDYPWYISSFWESPSRIQRIEEYFLNHDTLHVELIRQMQNDVVSVHAREFVEEILPVLRRNASDYQFAEAIPYLEAWDYSYEPGSAAASILDLFMIRLADNTLRGLIGDEGYEAFIRVENVPVRVMTRLFAENSRLLDNPIHPEFSNRDELIAGSMDETIQWLRDTQGRDPIDWQWENLHTVTLEPPLLGEAAGSDEAPAIFRMIVRNLLSKGPYPVSGNGLTVNKGEYHWFDPFEIFIGPSIRRIIDFSEPGRSLSVLPTGQSGNPLSDFYGDQTDLWLNGQYRYFYRDSTFFRDISYQTTRLTPRPD